MVISIRPYSSKRVLEKFGYIPERLEVDYQERSEHFHLKKEGLLEEGEQFRDALTQDWWSSTIVQPTEIIHQIDKKVTRSRYNHSDTFIGWKSDNGKVDNDAAMCIDKATGNIEELHFRADLREEHLTFLRAMVAMANQYDWLLMDLKGNLAAPNFRAVVELIKQSNAYRFLTDPKQFFEDLERENRSSAEEND